MPNVRRYDTETQSHSETRYRHLPVESIIPASTFGRFSDLVIGHRTKLREREHQIRRLVASPMARVGPRVGDL